VPFVLPSQALVVEALEPRGTARVCTRAVVSASTRSVTRRTCVPWPRTRI